MTYICDLHTHTRASDGQYAPAQLVRLAGERGLEVLAVTDHDTLDGLDEAMQEGERQGVRVLRGIELGAREHRSLHLLGYGFSTGEPALRELCRTLQKSREERKYRILDFLKERGVYISLEEVEQLAGKTAVGRPHFAQIMVRRGYVRDNREAFQRYLDTDEYQRIERFKASARTCIETVRSAGGRVSLAHPCQLKYEDGQLEELVKELAGYGLEGIECYYPRHTPAQQAFYLRLAEKYGLHPTGGSDFHGELVKPDIRLAALPLELEWLIEGQGM